ncbi:hypothetical protein PIB30_082552 [Stylosanthes scabra]|uniref:Uncharacterized protein n=1 Tax=Stylosanthes scabra TaxID=79078 RepID=A0ABU6WQA8_9FABA|nr:hypothetical protein [Stylosanthes scabra]
MEMWAFKKYLKVTSSENAPPLKTFTPLTSVNAHPPSPPLHQHRCSLRRRSVFTTLREETESVSTSVRRRCSLQRRSLCRNSLCLVNPQSALTWSRKPSIVALRHRVRHNLPPSALPLSPLPPPRLALRRGATRRLTSSVPPSCATLGSLRL